MRKTVETVTCDMCGAEIDIDDDATLRASAISGGYYGVLVHEHNPSYAEGLQTGVEHAQLDLCPACADRACAIHREVVPTDGGRSCRHVYTWREGS